MCTECGGQVCAHGYWPDCESGVCGECAEELLLATDEDDQELGGES